METTTINEPATTERLQQDLARLRERVAELERERRNGGPPAAQARPYRVGTPVSPALLVHRSTLAPYRDELDELLAEQADRLNAMRAAREELRRVYAAGARKVIPLEERARKVQAGADSETSPGDPLGGDQPSPRLQGVSSSRFRRDVLRPRRFVYAPE